MNQKKKPVVALILPIYNAARDIPKLMPAIMQQTLRPDHMLVIDSSSKDRSQQLLADYPVTIHTIKQSEFDHGGTRKLGTQLVDADIYIYLTQDAYPANPRAFRELVDFLEQDESIGCVYGRQLPKPEATPVSAHLRVFNYPKISQIRCYADRKKYGIKTCFSSDSFAAYKKVPLDQAGNFPEHLITGEDAYVAAKMLLKGYSVGYAATAEVYHSHNFNLKEEFHRYFSIGVFHGRENWIVKSFASATGEGLRFVKSELRYLVQQKKIGWIPRALASTWIKFVAYHLGLREKRIPHFIKRNIGINKAYWRNQSMAVI